MVKILSKIPSKRVRSVGDQSDAGFSVALIFLDVRDFLIISTMSDLNLFSRQAI